MQVIVMLMELGDKHVSTITCDTELSNCARGSDAYGTNGNSKDTETETDDGNGGQIEAG
jgi:hypothetical protein